MNEADDDIACWVEEICYVKTASELGGGGGECEGELFGKMCLWLPVSKSRGWVEVVREKYSSDESRNSRDEIR